MTCATEGRSSARRQEPQNQTASVTIVGPRLTEKGLCWMPTLPAQGPPLEELILSPSPVFPQPLQMAFLGKT